MTTTIATMFDTAITRLEEQNERSYDDINDVCRYRFENRSCLFGHMISDENYNETLEGHLAYNYSVVKAIEKTTGINLFDHFDRNEIAILQDIHDNEWDVKTPFKSLIPHPIATKIWGENAIS